jgi:hypothetical protein
MVRHHEKRRLLPTAAGLASALALAGAAQAGGTLTPLASYADPNGGSTAVLGINNAGYMTGSIGYADGSGLGFLRTPGGVYSTFSEDFFTSGRAIDPSNNITGYATDSTGILLTDKEFLRTPGGSTTVLQNPLDASFLHGIAQGINSLGAIVGDYYTSLAGHPRDGYILSGSTFTDLSVPGSTSTHARGITDSGEVAGWTVIGGVTEGFLWNSGVFTFVNDPNAAGGQGTVFEGINNHGIVSGEWNDASGNGHPFEYDTHTGAFTEIFVPGAGNADAFGINNLNQAVITTDISVGPNNFVYTPTPEPATWATLLLGVFGAGAMLRRRRALASA